MENEKETVRIGIIGMGEMGKMYADRLSKGGWKRYVRPLSRHQHAGADSELWRIG